MLLVGDFIPQRLSVRLPEEFSSQIVLANLEGPICGDGLPVSNKVGICLHTTSTETLFDSIKTFAFSLANNHLMDFREDGLRQTKQALGKYGIPCAGAGENEADARKPMLLEENGKRIAVFCCCERQFGMATETTAGCAEKGVWLYNAIRETKKSGGADYVIVSCHAASEFSPWVSPDLHDFYHSLIDAGADCIHGHHAHVPQGYEEYKGRPIFYGLGNFIVDPKMWANNKNQLWSLVAEVFWGDDAISWNVKPYGVSLTDGKITVTKSCAKEFADFDRYVANANIQFTSNENLHACWQEAACRLYYRFYARNLRPPALVKLRLPFRDRLRLAYFALGELWRAVMGRERPTPKSLFYGKVFYNAFNCESHTEMVRAAMGIYCGVEPDLRTQAISESAEVLGL